MLACRPLRSPFTAPARPFAARQQRADMQRKSALRASTAEVAESLHLLRFGPEASEEEISQAVDGIWSLQYLAAGPICGSAGQLSQFRIAPAAGAAAGPVAQLPYTHAVLFRYASASNRERFEAQPRVQLMLGSTGAPGAAAVCTLNFSGRVPNELEAVFRRGAEWEAGAELVLALRLQGGAAEGEADEFLSLTQQLALSSAFGAVQCSYGRCDSASHGGAAQQAQQPDLVLLARFQEVAQLQQFLGCPPVAALLEGDGRLPLAALWSCVLQSEPSDSSSSRGVGGGGLM